MPCACDILHSSPRLWRSSSTTPLPPARVFIRVGDESLFFSDTLVSQYNVCIARRLAPPPPGKRPDRLQRQTAKARLKSDSSDDDMPLSVLKKKSQEAQSSRKRRRTKKKKKKKKVKKEKKVKRERDTGNSSTRRKTQ